MSLASVGKATALGCTVVSTISLEKSEGLAAPVRVAAFRLSWISATSFSSPIRWRQRVSDDPVERQLVTEEFLAAEELEVRVLDPARAEFLVGQIVRVLEDRKTR